MTRRSYGTPSIRDVAAAAGVSYQTVSRVLNDSPRVNPGTRRQVLDAIERLGYRPDRAARALGSGQSSAVTVVVANTTLYGYAATLQGIEEAARAAGLAVGVRVVESEDPADVRSAVEHVSDHNAGATVASRPWASGGSYVGYVGNGGTLTVPRTGLAAGQYNLTVAYAQAEKNTGHPYNTDTITRTLVATEAGGNATSAPYLRNYTWDGFWEATSPLDLTTRGGALTFGNPAA
ncbi:LacI family DNA-binding transcriptional regulator [Lentzea sp. NPDC051213]|uniref:LacI family DNA-binding transcriptional regulator n=1 Tax=Lentzea sp. NPDC051213 TaxID=3364126 RepID=UPI003799423D